MKNVRANSTGAQSRLLPGSTAKANRTQLLSNLKRVVVKVGTRVLSADDHTLDVEYLGRLASEIAAVRAGGTEVVLVTSGAVGAGMGRLAISTRPKSVEELQACAAVGQVQLMHHYKLAFREHGIVVGQLLLTASDFRGSKDHYIHIQQAFRGLAAADVLPIVNENDTVAVEELRYGDNDQLSAHVANLAGADALIMLTTADGLCMSLPDTANSAAEVIETIEEITPEISALAMGTDDQTSIGGMKTKLLAAKMLMASGVLTLIAHGRRTTLAKILAGENVGTLFLPRVDRSTSHKRYILAQSVEGTLTLDSGATEAIVNGGKSLLPSGIASVNGTFGPGDAVSLRAPNDLEIARGIATYGVAEMRAIAGHHSSEIVSLLGYHGGDEAVHRDNLVLL